MCVFTMGISMDDPRQPARKASAAKRPINVSVSRDLIDQARALGINVSQACERGLALQIADARAARWLTENREALDSSNAHVERHGLPLARYRGF
jgi:antitoxin CcdA